VAADAVVDDKKMELATAKGIIRDLARAEVRGISFTAGEPFLYFDDLLELVDLCRELGFYTRIVTNSSWATTTDTAQQRLTLLKQCGLSQLRLSYSRWHQAHVPRQNVLNAALGCIQTQIDYFISFVTDFSEEDDNYEQFLRAHKLKFFPEPVIYAGRAGNLDRKTLCTDYQDNRCAMNPYLAPDLNLYACCDAGSHFTTTNFFLLGNLRHHSVEQLFAKSETDLLYNCIRSLGITTIASFAGFKARDIITYRKCELCQQLFDMPETLNILRESGPQLRRWVR
jgi:organic radical activating enzyme